MVSSKLSLDWPFAILEKSLIWPFTLNLTIRLFWPFVGPESSDLHAKGADGDHFLPCRVNVWYFMHYVTYDRTKYFWPFSMVMNWSISTPNYVLSIAPFSKMKSKNSISVNSEYCVLEFFVSIFCPTNQLKTSARQPSKNDYRQIHGARVVSSTSCRQKLKM